MAGGPAGEVLVTVGRCNYGRTFARSEIAPGVGAISTGVAFGVGGGAHIVYEEAGGDEICCSSGIRYIRSQKPPYNSWSAPVTLGSDIYNGEQTPRAPALVVSPCGNAGSVLHVVWLTNWRGLQNYNVYYTRKLAGNHPWSDSLQVSDYTVAQGDRAEAGIAAAADKAIAVWGSGAFGNPFAVWSSRIAPGIPCP